MACALPRPAAALGRACWPTAWAARAMPTFARWPARCADWMGALARMARTRGRRAAARTPPGPGGRARDWPTALTQRLDAAADALAATPLGQMSAADLPLGRGLSRAPQPPTRAALLAGRIVAVGRDAAFCFIYAANLQTWRCWARACAFFSPLDDAALAACDAVWLPGGYPELHGRAASPPTPCHAGKACSRPSRQGRPLWAECGGMMALFESGNCRTARAPRCGACCPAAARMHKRLARLGPQRLICVEGRAARPHLPLLHVAPAAPPWSRAQPARWPVAPDAGEALYRMGSLHASYFHAWFAVQPRAVAHLLGGEGA
jgi:cobyrinic acid a,c-diamide synthase